MLTQRWNHFLVCSASDEIVSSYAEPVMKYIPRMLSIFWMLSMCENWCWAYENTISVHNVRFQSFSSLPHVTRSSVPFPRPCLTSFVPSLYFVSPPLSPLSQLCSLSPDLCTLSINCPSVPFFVALQYVSRWSCPFLLCFLSSVPPSLVLCPLSFILQECKFFYFIYKHPTTFSGAEEMKQRTTFNSFVPTSCSSPHFSSGSASHEIVSTYAHLLSQRWNCFLVCSVRDEIVSSCAQ